MVSDFFVFLIKFDFSDRIFMNIIGSKVYFARKALKYYMHLMDNNLS